VFRELCKR
jgi:hypothetical protein